MKASPNILLASLCALFLLESCQTTATNSDTPALIVRQTEAGRAELRNTLSGLFGGQEIILADDALTHSSMLVLQHTWKQKPDGQPALGRNVARPFRFRLIKRGDSCFLVDMRDGQGYLLAGTICTPE